MKIVFYSICVAGVALTVIPTCLKFYGGVGDAVFKQLMLAGAICWFVGATTLLVGRKTCLK